MVLFPESAHQQGNALSHLGGEFTHHSIVIEDDSGVRQNGHISRVRIAMKEAVFKDLLIDQACHGDGEIRRIRMLSDEAIGISNGDTGDIIMVRTRLVERSRYIAPGP